MKIENFEICQNILGQISSRDVQIALERNYEGKKIYKLKFFSFMMKQIRWQISQVFYCSQSTMKIVFKLFWRPTNFENCLSFPKQAIQAMNFKKLYVTPDRIGPWNN